jgi:hypothetical protein
LPIRNRDREVHLAHASLRGRFHVPFGHATPSDHRRALDGLPHLDDGFDFRFTHRRNARFDLVYTGTLERAGDVDLLFAGERYAWGLLTISKRTVIDDDRWRLHRKHGGSAFCLLEGQALRGWPASLARGPDVHAACQPPVALRAAELGMRNAGARTSSGVRHSRLSEVLQTRHSKPAPPRLDRLCRVQPSS